MLSAIHDTIATVTALIGAFGVFIKFGVLGMVATTVAYFAGGIISRGFGALSGLAVAALIGLVVVGGANGLSFFQDAQALQAKARVQQLEAENRAKAAKLDELRVTNAKLQAFLGEERQVAEKNATTIERLNAMIDATEDNPDCTLSEDFVNELEKLR